MNKKVFKIIIILIAILAIILGIMYLIDLDKMSQGKPVVFSTWGRKYAPIEFNITPENDSNNTENYQKYFKVINNTRLELNIPNEWNYEELAKDEKSDYKYALKLYKDSNNKYAILYFYNNKFAVCGTGRTSKNITLNNGNEATIGYYDGSKIWSDISFYTSSENIAVLNYSLAYSDAEEVIEFIKTINIINEYSFCGTITQVEENLFFVEPDKSEEIRKSGDKIMVKKLEIDTNVKVEIGERVRIFYDGDIMETYPVQINVTRYESID